MLKHRSGQARASDEDLQQRLLPPSLHHYAFAQNPGPASLAVRACGWEQHCCTTDYVSLPLLCCLSANASYGYETSGSLASSSFFISSAVRQGNRERWDANNNEKTWSLLEVLREIADARGKTVAQAALNWLLQKPGVTAPILGVRSVAQLEENIGAANWALTAEEMKKLDEASEPEVSYPYDAFADRQQRRGRET